MKKIVDKMGEKTSWGEYLPVRVNFEAKMKKPSFELNPTVWRAGILPLNYSRTVYSFYRENAGLSKGMVNSNY